MFSTSRDTSILIDTNSKLTRILQFLKSDNRIKDKNTNAVLNTIKESNFEKGERKQYTV